MKKNIIILTILISSCFLTHAQSQYEAVFRGYVIMRLDSILMTKNNWEKIDTINLEKNEFLIFELKYTVITNGKYAYVNGEVLRANVNFDESDKEQYLIDYSQANYYDIGNKKRFICANERLPFASYTSDTSNFYNLKLNRNDYFCNVLFCKDIPKEIKGLFITTKNKWGVSKFWNNKVQYHLVSVKECEHQLNFKHLLNNAKENCILQKGDLMDLAHLNQLLK